MGEGDGLGRFLTNLVAVNLVFIYCFVVVSLKHFPLFSKKFNQLNSNFSDFFCQLQVFENFIYFSGS